MGLGIVLSTSYASTDSRIESNSVLNKGVCTVTITVTSSNLSYSWTESYYAVSSSHCAMIAQDRLRELQTQEVVDISLEAEPVPEAPEVPAD